MGKKGLLGSRQETEVCVCPPLLFEDLDMLPSSGPNVMVRFQVGLSTWAPNRVAGLLNPSMCAQRLWARKNHAGSRYNA